MTKRLRCAIYTRKSSEEGLEQDFNSLHAQREACEAYVLSQTGEGWSALANVYDDGGFSGGSIERPALKRLLADIDQGKVDVVVVYKVDRLTRSLADFAKIVEAFDARGVSFVSVTQAFNTTSSMGRLTLNVLLSFAQFEREVTAERIRDKIAASKAKGMWMGGTPPLGYDVHERKLTINPAEADVIRQVFTRYLATGSAKDVARELKDAGIRSKAWTTVAGRPMGGCVIGRGGVYHLLQSRLYIGEIVHKGTSFPGLHQPIIDRETFEAANALLSSKAARRRDQPTKVGTAPLKGLLFDAAGKPMTPSFGYGRRGRLYRYYIAPKVDDPEQIARLSAPLVEAWLSQVTGRLLGLAKICVEDLKDHIRRVEVRSDAVHLVLHGQAFEDRRADLALIEIGRRLVAGEHAVEEPGCAFGVRIILPQRLVLRGGRCTLKGATIAQKPAAKLALAKLVKRGHAELLRRKASPFTQSGEHRQATAPITQHERNICRLAFMDPQLQRQILQGEAPYRVKPATVIKRPMPLAWADQRQWLENLSATDPC